MEDLAREFVTAIPYGSTYLSVPKPKQYSTRTGIIPVTGPYYDPHALGNNWFDSRFEDTIPARLKNPVPSIFTQILGTSDYTVMGYTAGDRKGYFDGHDLGGPATRGMHDQDGYPQFTQGGGDLNEPPVGATIYIVLGPQQSRVTNESTIQVCGGQTLRVIKFSSQWIDDMYKKNQVIQWPNGVGYVFQDQWYTAYFEGRLQKGVTSQSYCWDYVKKPIRF